MLLFVRLTTPLCSDLTQISHDRSNKKSWPKRPAFEITPIELVTGWLGVSLFFSTKLHGIDFRWLIQVAVANGSVDEKPIFSFFNFPNRASTKHNFRIFEFDWWCIHLPADAIYKFCRLDKRNSFYLPEGVIDLILAKVMNERLHWLPRCRRSHEEKKNESEKKLFHDGLNIIRSPALTRAGPNKKTQCCPLWTTLLTTQSVKRWLRRKPFSLPRKDSNLEPRGPKPHALPIELRSIIPTFHTESEVSIQTIRFLQQ